jgi:hypothetical protein
MGYRISKRGTRYYVLKNGKAILGGYTSKKKATQAKSRRKAQDRYARRR